MKNIIFFVSGEKKPSGGNKVIYQCSNIINSLENYKSCVIHIKKKKIDRYLNSFKKLFVKNKKKQFGWNFNNISVEKKPFTDWSSVNINTKHDLIFDRKNDHVILPEIYAHLAEDFFIKKKITYSIFVQNGYSIMSSSKRKKIYNSYKNAKSILSVSKDINKCILILFPNLIKKIVNIVPLIDFKKLIFKKKQNLITYMPRKLIRHSELLIFFLQNYLPKKWKIKAIDNLSENKVYDYLKKSKIFLSFSYLEGLGLPPIEAALAGNKIIGYTGEAGEENWKRPIFIKINNGEIKNFYIKVLKNINDKSFLKRSNNQRKILSNKYSRENQIKSIIRFLEKIKKIN